MGRNTNAAENKGSFAKGESNQIGKILRTDPGGKSYQDSERYLKTNERRVAENMPLLRDFKNYADWDTDARRWARTLRNRPISMGVDYFINNLNDIETSILDNNAGGFLKHKSKEKLKKTRKKS